MAAAVLACTVLWLLEPPERIRAWMSEDGLVENLSWIGYLVAAAAVWVLLDARVPLRRRVEMCLLLLCCAARELDWHKAFTGASILKVTFYKGPAPWSTKLAALAVVLAVAVVLVDLLRQGWRSGREGWRRREPAMVTVLVLLATLVVSKVTDRSLNAIREVSGWRAPESWYALQAAFEEPLEMMLPVLALLAMAQYRRGRPSPARG